MGNELYTIKVIVPIPLTYHYSINGIVTQFRDSAFVEKDVTPTRLNLILDALGSKQDEAFEFAGRPLDTKAVKAWEIDLQLSPK